MTEILQRANFPSKNFLGLKFWKRNSLTWYRTVRVPSPSGRMRGGSNPGSVPGKSLFYFNLFFLIFCFSFLLLFWLFFILCCWFWTNSQIWKEKRAKQNWKTEHKFYEPQIGHFSTQKFREILNIKIHIFKKNPHFRREKKHLFWSVVLETVEKKTMRCK